MAARSTTPGTARTIRPNVASGGLAGALMTLVLIAYNVFVQGGALDETGLLTITGALTIVLQTLFAYYAGPDQKTLFSAIGGVVAVIIAAAIAYFAGLPVPQSALYDALVALANVALTAYVGNTKPE